MHKLSRAPFLTDHRCTSSFQGASQTNRGGCMAKKVERKRCRGRAHVFIGQGATSSENTVHHPHLQVISTATVRFTLRHCLPPPGCSLAEPLSVTPSQSLSSLRYLIIRQFLASATCCSRVLGPPDYRASLKSPPSPRCVCLGICACDSVFDFKKNEGGGDYTYSKSFGR